MLCKWKLNFSKTQRDLATSINQVIDKYWEDEIDEVAMMI